MASSSKSTRFPSYCLHSASGQAVVRFNGHDYYLGPHGSSASYDEYDRLVGEWMLKGRQAPSKVVRDPVGEMSVSELMLA